MGDVKRVRKEGVVRSVKCEVPDYVMVTVSALMST